MPTSGGSGRVRAPARSPDKRGLKDRVSYHETIACYPAPKTYIIDEGCLKIAELKSFDGGMDAGYRIELSEAWNRTDKNICNHDAGNWLKKVKTRNPRLMACRMLLPVDSRARCRLPAFTAQRLSRQDWGRSGGADKIREASTLDAGDGSSVCQLRSGNGSAAWTASKMMAWCKLGDSKGQSCRSRRHGEPLNPRVNCRHGRKHRAIMAIAGRKPNACSQSLGAWLQHTQRRGCLSARLRPSQARAW